MDKYEYKVIRFTSGDTEKLTDTLNKFGQEGWHVITASPDSYKSPRISEGYSDGGEFKIIYEIIIERKIITS